MMRSWPPGGATLISGAPLTNPTRLQASRPAHPVLHFEPIGRAAGTVGRVLLLRDDAFKTQCASMGEDGRAVTLHVFVEPAAGASLGHDRCERSSADFRPIAPQVVASQLDQVEGLQERAVIMAAVANEIERGNAVVIAGDSFAVDDAGAGAQACHRLNDQREAMGEIVARTAIEPHLCAILAGNDAEAVVLDLMQPLPDGIRRFCR